MTVVTSGARAACSARLISGVIVCIGLSACSADTALQTSALGPAVSTTNAATRPKSSLTNEDAAASARGQICQIAFDAAKLKAGYLDHEMKQGLAPEQLEIVRSTYDAAFAATLQDQAGIAKKCAESQTDMTGGNSSVQFKQAYRSNVVNDINRFRSGQFGSNEQAKAAGSFDAKNFWKDQDDN